MRLRQVGLIYLVLFLIAQTLIFIVLNMWLDIDMVKGLDRIGISSSMNILISTRYFQHNTVREVNGPKDDVPLHDQVNFAVPNIAHVVLCGNMFTFANYLSLLSIQKIIRPFRILLYMKDTPKVDNWGYNTWFDQALKEIPNIELMKADISHDNESSCLKIAISSLAQYGGIFVGSRTLFQASMPNFRKGLSVGIVDGLSSLPAFVFSGKDLAVNVKPLKALAARENPHAVLEDGTMTETVNCHTVTEPISAFAPGRSPCWVLDAQIFPKDIFKLNSTLGFYLRYLFYGYGEIRHINPNLGTPIPNIVHYVWLGGGECSFLMYLSVLSSIKIIKPTNIYIHGDVRPTGKYCDLILSQSLVSFNNYGPVHRVYGKRLTFIQHASDIIRTDVLRRYGGIYIDCDALWLKPLDELIYSGYDTIVSLDHADRTPFPDTINMGVMLAKPGAKFLEYLQESFRDYGSRGPHVTFHAVENVYKVYERHPEVLHIDKTLQVMCFRLKCHPLWLSDYKDVDVHHDFDWRNDAYAIHFTSPTPVELEDERLLNITHGFFADIGRYILNYK